MKRFFVATAMLLFCAMLASAADVTGKWKGSFDLDGNPVPVVLDLKTASGAVTGTITTGANKPSEIKEGKLDGNALSFTFTTEYQGNPVSLVVKGQLGSDEIKVTMATSEGSWSTEFSAKKS